MQVLIGFVVRHGYAFLFASVFANQVGLPVPSVLCLLAAGALAATGRLDVIPTVGVAVVGCVLADCVWYEAGRRRGERVLRALHRFAPDPEMATSRAKRTFARFGSLLLLVAKFVPMLDAVVPPLAGTSRTGRVRFLAFDAMGSALWASAYTALGYVFSHDLDRVADRVSRVGTVSVTIAVGTALVGAVIVVVRTRRSNQTAPRVSLRTPVRRDVDSLISECLPQALRMRT
jgi:membrane protein DedA with SNARE-associated domain